MSGNGSLFLMTDSNNNVPKWKNKFKYFIIIALNGLNIIKYNSNAIFLSLKKNKAYFF